MQQSALLSQVTDGGAPSGMQHVPAAPSHVRGEQHGRIELSQGKPGADAQQLPSLHTVKGMQTLPQLPQLFVSCGMQVPLQQKLRTTEVQGVVSETGMQVLPAHV